MDARGFHPRDWRQGSEVAHRLLVERIEAFIAALDAFASAAAAPVIITTLPQPAAPQVGALDGHHPDGAAFLVHAVNRALRDLAARNPRIALVDADLAMAALAPVQRIDPKLWFYGRIPYSAPATRALAQAIAAVVAVPGRPPVKVLALDLDDTLWRGLYGEQGVVGLECGDDFPGNAFKALQEECLRLKSQGLLLTILSKNDPDALRVFDEHPGMALRRDDFLAHRINWQPKADNIRELAAELNLGLDSFLFLDDSPHEREAMRRLAPVVRVPELPVDPALRPDFLRALVDLWPARLTEEDRRRSDLYAAQIKGRGARTEAASLEDYLAGLEQVLVVGPVTAATIPRIAQMHARTNQFNLTTRRFSEPDFTTMIADPDRYCLLQGQVSDKFGEHGIVICAVAKIDGPRASVESFLMSCRVIGREVETAFLGALLAHLSDRAIDEVAIRFSPTERNAPAQDFGERTGLGPAAVADDGSRIWTWQPRTGAHVGSKFVKVTL
ncbi:MAG: HAD-IIIC family phosphatase [Hyphomicrobiaceae bacterium]